MHEHEMSGEKKHIYNNCTVGINCMTHPCKPQIDRINEEILFKENFELFRSSFSYCLYFNAISTRYDKLHFDTI